MRHFTLSTVFAYAALATAGPTVSPRAVDSLNEAATAEAHQRDATATRAFSNVEIKTSDGRCLFIDKLSGDFRANLTPIQVAACGSTDGQGFDVITAGKHNNAANSALIVSTLTQACFNFDPRRAAGNQVLLFSCGGRADGSGQVTTSQLFPFSGGAGPLQFKPENEQGSCFTVKGNVVDIAACNANDANQSFTFGGTPSGNGGGKGGGNGGGNAASSASTSETSSASATSSTAAEAEASTTAAQTEAPATTTQGAATTTTTGGAKNNNKNKKGKKKTGKKNNNTLGGKATTTCSARRTVTKFVGSSAEATEAASSTDAASTSSSEDVAATTTTAGTATADTTTADNTTAATTTTSATATGGGNGNTTGAVKAIANPTEPVPVSRAGGTLNPTAAAEAQQRDDTATRAFTGAEIRAPNGQCLFVDPTAGDFRENLIPVSLVDCSGTPNEKWDVITAGKHNNAQGAAIIVSSLMNGCISTDERRAAGDTVTMFSCGGRADGSGETNAGQTFPFVGQLSFAFAPRSDNGKVCVLPGDQGRLVTGPCPTDGSQLFSVFPAK